MATTLDQFLFPIIFAIFALAIGVLVWGYRRAKPFGKLGKLAWLQSVVLMAPWLLYFVLFSFGLSISLPAVLVLLLVSGGIYIYLGRQMREEGQAELLRQKAAQRLQNLANEADQTTGLGDSTANTNLEETSPIPPEDLAIIKGIFSIDSFFTTETIAYQEGAIFKGNLRTEAEDAFAKLSGKLKQLMGEKYRLFLVEGSEDRPVVVILPSTNDPQPSTLAQKNLAVVLLVATIVTTLEASAALLGFDLVDNWQRVGETVPLAIAVGIILLAHELGHLWQAKKWGVRLSWPFFLPNWQIGSFGAITRFESLLPSRNALFDVAIAGPAMGGLVSLLFLIVGLSLSGGNNLFQLPVQFLQGSLLVGTLAKLILGSALKSSVISIHPLTVLGWLGLVINALNLLPAGQLDGGRIVQAIYGRKVARRTTIATLVILGAVSLFNPANPIPLYWAIVVLFLQRQLERPSLNELTEPDDTRAGLGLLALLLMLLTLIPFSPNWALRLGIGG
ncbi:MULTISPECIES: site-2 protease family protein [unclassified Synechocystis]|uniref:site-2 protease family protein n=1 Tax=unclassified Synechocystis TaxID=2640012 RepID=UPI00040FEFC9|nr:MULTISPECIES: site-2 protease family protein [unclassified Synechocystis]AIE75167.1 Zinc metalloprotease [Synechocystis sp. PCC 6714]MCT0252930.1 site-2 protease family protein [Synechocystis sp. CS-94]